MTSIQSLLAKQAIVQLMPLSYVIYALFSGFVALVKAIGIILTTGELLMTLTSLFHTCLFLPLLHFLHRDRISH